MMQPCAQMAFNSRTHTTNEILSGPCVIVVVPGSGRLAHHASLSVGVVLEGALAQGSEYLSWCQCNSSGWTRVAKISLPSRRKVPRFARTAKRSPRDVVTIWTTYDAAIAWQRSTQRNRRWPPRAIRKNAITANMHFRSKPRRAGGHLHLGLRLLIKQWHSVQRHLATEQQVLFGLTAHRNML